MQDPKLPLSATYGFGTIAMPPILIITTSIQLVFGTAQLIVKKLPEVMSTLFALQSGGQFENETSIIRQ